MIVATQFQNRLVGTLVLVSLCVIFLPDVFDGKKSHFQRNYEAIPLRKESDTELLNVLVEPTKDFNYELVTTIERHNPLDHLTTEITTIDYTVNSEQDYQYSAWIIRLGTFRNIDNARNLVSRLRSKGYPAQLMPRDLEQGELARVEVGPNVSKDKLAAMTTDLESLTGLKGQLLKFNPINP